MKYLRYQYIFLFFISVFLFNSCNKEVYFNSENEVNCENLKNGIIELNAEAVKLQINKLTGGLTAMKNNAGLDNQRDNLNVLISRINSNCSNLNASLSCYACIYTYPPQSEILIEVDSVDKKVCRIIDISTPDNDVLRGVGIHEAGK